MVTSRNEKILQRVSFVQNKVSHDSSWSIDEEQLFLLKNFPPFTGVKGMFSGMKNVLFFNKSKCLGSFGLFNSPGEMLFISAPLISEFKCGKKSISKSDISYYSSNNQSNYSFIHHSPYWNIDPESFYAIHCYLEERRRDGAFSPLSNNFLNNEIFARDLYDFAKNWTELNFGELTYLYNNKEINPILDGVINSLMRTTNVDRRIRSLFSNNDTHQINHEELGGVKILLMHFNISSED